MVSMPALTSQTVDDTDGKMICKQCSFECDIGKYSPRPMNKVWAFIVKFPLTVVNDFRWFLSQFSTNFHEILQALFSNNMETTLKFLFENTVSLKVSLFTM